MGFDSVELDLHRYLAHEAKIAALADFVENEMIAYKDEAVKRFYIVSNSRYSELVAAATAFGYREELPEAISIVDELRLEDKHIAALLGDEEWMRKLVEKERQDELEDWLYASINY